MFHLEAHTKWKEDSISEGIRCVLVFNDDAIPMAFVVYLLRHVFQKDADEARRIMLGAHRDGIAICAVYSRREDAVSKVAEASSLAREHGHPLMLRYCWGDAVAPVLSRAKMAVFNWLKRMDKVVWKAFWQGV
jgi:ATP-dependent Clp protease adaptor protein ClpS